jgi:hypothetical protein
LISLALLLCAFVAVWLIWPAVQRRLGWGSPLTPVRRSLRRRRSYRRRSTPGL